MPRAALRSLPTCTRILNPLLHLLTGRRQAIPRAHYCIGRSHGHGW
jgi:hypothetical protein